MPMSGMANGTIQPNCFIKLDSTTPANYKYIQCVANGDTPYGISQDGSEDPPGVNGSATDAARVGIEFQFYTTNDICLLVVGTGGWSINNPLMSDASGHGIPQSGSNPIGAIALSTEAAGTLGRVRVLSPQLNG